MHDNAINHALVFIKPEAANHAAAVAHVHQVLAANAVQIRREGVLTGSEMAAANLLDQHYLPIATAACQVRAQDLPLTAAARQQFRSAFGIEWDHAAVVNADEAQQRYRLDAERLAQLCLQAPQRARLAPGVYVAKPAIDDTADVYVVNGFYPELRQRYLRPEAHVRWLDVQFTSADLHWQDFRDSVIGATDPATARPGSLRRQFYQQAPQYGLSVPVSIRFNCIHASASALEGSRERLIWCKLKPSQDPFLQSLHASGIDWPLIQTFLRNPMVRWQNQPEQPLFDIVEDLDASAAQMRLLSIAPQLQEQRKAA